MNKRKTVLIGMLILSSLSGCKVFETLEGTKENDPDAFANAYELSPGKAYVWDHPGEEDIKKDLKQERTGEDVFFLCPKGDISFKGSELNETDEYKRSLWISADKDDKIPTVTDKNALIYVSDTEVPKEIVFERFADYGYSIGISNFIKDAGGHYYIVYAETEEDDYKHYIDPKSEAAKVTELETLPRLYLDKVGGMSVSDNSITDGGTVKYLEKDKSYICEFYTGTFYQDYLIKADVRSFGSIERFVCHDYEFLHANCIKIGIPDWFKSGYYYVQGVGLIRYVEEKDLKAYSGKPYDTAIDWNEPIKEYDEYGVCIYDPSLSIDRRIDETSDAGVPETELVIGPENTEEGRKNDGTVKLNPLDSDGT